MKRHWYILPLIASVVAVSCAVFDAHIINRGYLHWVVRLFGVDFGIVRAKAHNSLIWFGERHTIPLDGILFCTAAVALGIAIAFTVRHFRLRSHDANTALEPTSTAP
jgi:hypothetical protein